MSTGPHMTPDEFRMHGRAIVDRIADYMEQVEGYRILPDVEPGSIREMLPAAAPEAPESFEAILRDVEEIVMPGVTHWQSPGWFAFFPANTSPPAILGDLLSSGLGQQGMLWSTSPACTEIEMVMMDWLVDLLALPEGWKTTGPGGGVIQMSASDSTHIALVVARRRAAPRAAVGDLVVYTSEQAHSSIEKGAVIAGYDHIRLVGVDGTFAMRPDALAAAIEADLADGLTPAAVCSSVGTTGTTAVDPIRAISEIASEHGIWHHVDAAYAGTAMICPEFRHYQDGLELVDSYVVNPHKWMLTNFDFSAFYVADRKPLVHALSILPPYLREQAAASEHVFDYRDWHVSMGRRFRSLKLWFVLRSYGAQGIRALVREHVRLARELADCIAADDRLELVAPVPFALVSFRHVAGDEATERIVAAVNNSGHSHVTGSEVAGKRFVRVSVGQTHTTARHVERLWTTIDTAAEPV